VLVTPNQNQDSDICIYCKLCSADCNHTVVRNLCFTSLLNFWRVSLVFTWTVKNACHFSVISVGNHEECCACHHTELFENLRNSDVSHCRFNKMRWIFQQRDLCFYIIILAVITIIIIIIFCTKFIAIYDPLVNYHLHPSSFWSCYRTQPLAILAVSSHNFAYVLVNAERSLSVTASLKPRYHTQKTFTAHYHYISSVYTL